MRFFRVQVHDNTRSPGNYPVLAPSTRLAERHASRHHKRVTGRRPVQVQVVG